MGSSLAAGVRALAETPQPAAPLMVVLGDMPLVNGVTLRLLAEAARTNPNQIIQPSFQSQPGHPVIWPADLRPRLAELTGDTGGKAVITQFAHRRTLLDWPDDSVIRDIDQPADLDEIRVRSGDSGGRVGRQTPVRYCVS